MGGGQIASGPFLEHQKHLQSFFEAKKVPKNLKNTNKYNPYGKRYSPYNEVFKGPYNTVTIKNFSEYIDISLDKQYTIIGIGKKNTFNTQDDFCAIGYGFKPPDNKGFEMNYIYNKQRAYISKKI